MTDEISKFIPLYGEAGFSFNIYLKHEKYGRAQFTFRAEVADKWDEVMEEAGKFLEKKLSQGWMPDEKIPRAVAAEAEKILKEEAAVNERAREITQGDGRHGFDHDKPVPADCLPPELDSKYDYYEERFDQVKITPEEDDRVTVRFLASGMEFPVGLMNKWSVEKASEHLARLGSIDFYKPKTHDIDGWLYWAYGKAYTNRNTGKSGRYKDVAYVERSLD